MALNFSRMKTANRTRTRPSPMYKYSVTAPEEEMEESVTIAAPPILVVPQVKDEAVIRKQELRMVKFREAIKEVV